MQYLVSVHSTAGSIGEAIDPEWQITLSDLPAAEALVTDLEAAIARDRYNRHYTTVTLTVVQPPTTVPDLTGDDLWAWVKQQTCCLNNDTED